MYTQSMPVKKVSSVAVQVPSEAVECEGVVTESPCDAVATQETASVEEVAATDSPRDVVATQETPSSVGDSVVTESRCDVNGIQEASYMYVEDGVEVGVTECVLDATNIHSSEIEAFNHDVNASSAEKSSEDNIDLPMGTDFSLNNIHEKNYSILIG